MCRGLGKYTMYTVTSVLDPLTEDRPLLLYVCLVSPSFPCSLSRRPIHERRSSVLNFTYQSRWSWWRRGKCLVLCWWCFLSVWPCRIFLHPSSDDVSLTECVFFLLCASGFIQRLSCHTEPNTRRDSQQAPRARTHAHTQCRGLDVCGRSSNSALK